MSFLSFNSTAKVAPRMHQNSPFRAQKSKIFLGRGPKDTPCPHPTAPSVCRLSCHVCLSSVCRLSVCLKRSCALLRRLKFSAMFLHHLVRWPSADIQVKFYRDRPSETPPSWELNTRGVAEYCDFGLLERYISETVQDRS